MAKAIEKLNLEKASVNLENIRIIREGKPDFSDNFFKEIRIKSLSHFYKRSQMEYQDFRNYFKLDLSNDDLRNQNFMSGDKKNSAQTLSELKEWTF